VSSSLVLFVAAGLLAALAAAFVCTSEQAQLLS
jgi:archaellum component FlaG (FlaF/FlaG flagellin family)